MFRNRADKCQYEDRGGGGGYDYYESFSKRARNKEHHLIREFMFLADIKRMVLKHMQHLYSFLLRLQYSGWYVIYILYTGDCFKCREYIERQALCSFSHRYDRYSELGEHQFRPIIVQFHVFTGFDDKEFQLTWL